MTHVFTYGSLMFAPVWEQLVKGQYRQREALLQGFRRHAVKAEEYPAVIPTSITDQVSGIIYLDVVSTDLAALDQFEGEYYTRETLPVVVADETLSAEVYVFCSQYYPMLSDELWDENFFLEKGLSRFLSQYKGFY